MRSVVVVLPASMWAAIPMFRVRSRGVCRGISFSALSARSVASPPVVREGLVGLRHLVGVFPLLDRPSPKVGGVHEFHGQFLDHGALGTLAGEGDDPTQGEGGATRGVHL